MAICKLNEPFAALSGAVGGASGVVAMPDKNGRTLLRDNVRPNFPATTQQYEINNWFSSVSSAFAQIGDTAKAAWELAASGLQETGRLGDPYGISGQMLYVRVNMYRLMDGQAVISTPPSTLGSAGPSGVTALIDGTTMVVNIEKDVAPSAGFYYVKVSGTDLTPSRNARQNELRAISADQSLSIVPIVTTTADQPIEIAVPQFPAQVGDRRGIGIIQLNADYFPVNGIFIPNIQFAEI